MFSPIRTGTQENMLDMGFYNLQEIYLTNKENSYWILLQKQE